MEQTIYERIVKRLAALKESGQGMSEHAVSVATGLGKDVVRDLRRKPEIMPRLDTITALARVLRTTPEWLAFGRGEETLGEGEASLQTVPLISWVAASTFADVPQFSGTEEWPQIHVGDLPSGRYMALTVKGDSMNRIAVHDSTIVVRTNDRQLIDRGFYIFRNNDEATFKRYRDQGGPVRMEPYSTNPEHEIIYPTEDVVPLGRVFRVLTTLYRPSLKRA